LPADISVSPSAVAAIKSVEVVLQVRGSVPDVQTGVYPITTLRSVVRVINCSQAASGQSNSCS
jgi:hypothetical protein